MQKRQERVEELLAGHREALDWGAAALLDKEVLDGEEFYALAGISHEEGSRGARVVAPGENGRSL
jgi:ATP-dependent Zn protease